MPNPPRATPPVVEAAVQERIHLLWDELAGYEAAKGEAALMHLLGAVAEMIGAQNAYWMGAVRLSDDERDPLRGWRPRLIRYLHPLPNDEKFTQQRLKSLQQGKVDEATVAQARLAGTFRACRLKDLVSPDWFSSPTYQGYVGRNVHDSLTVGVPVNPIAEAYYGFLRMRENDPFTEAQRDVAYVAMRGLTWFHRQVMLAHGIVAAGSPLSPMERRVLALLLTDQSEKLIAANLKVTPATAHTYVRGVLRKFGVSGRNGLIALWLGRLG
jgi:DNA-binding CsgD family transcriptional regulator